MSETNEERTGPVLQAASEFEADPTVAKRTILFAAINAAKTPRFYAIGDRLILWAGGTERQIADCRGPAVAQALRDQLNADLAAGWVPSLPS